MTAPATNGASASAPRIRWNRVLAMVILMLLVGEGLSQIYMRIWSGQPFRTLALYRWSPYGLVRNNPRLTSPRFSINENGFRNRAVFTREKPANTLRIIMLGGSVLYSGIVPGAGRVNEPAVSSDETMAQYLQKRLEADSALAGVHIEVINAGINFNRILEVTSGYLADYVFWNPDFVIVCGSGNNFTPVWPAPIPPGGRNFIQADHPWRNEFDRIVNRNSLASWLEVTSRTAAEHSAAAALMNKVFQKSVDKAIDMVTVRAAVRAASKPREFGSQAEINDMLHDYFGDATAIIATATEHKQKVAFFWEYFLGELEGIKPMSDQERLLYPKLRGITKDPRDKEFHFAMRDSVQARVTGAGAAFIDPLPELGAAHETVYMDYLHYTKKGNEIMANAMYDRLAPAIRTRAAEILGTR